MGSPGVFSTEQNWNKLGLRGFSSSKRVTFSKQYVSFTELVPARSTRSWTEPVAREMSDEELLKMAEAEGHFAFLDDPSEDIYTWGDGEEL